MKRDSSLDRGLGGGGKTSKNMKQKLVLYSKGRRGCSLLGMDSAHQVTNGNELEYYRAIILESSRAREIRRKLFKSIVGHFLYDKVVCLLLIKFI